MGDMIPSGSNNLAVMLTRFLFVGSMSSVIRVTSMTSNWKFSSVTFQCTLSTLYSLELSLAMHVGS